MKRMMRILTFMVVLSVFTVAIAMENGTRNALPFEDVDSGQWFYGYVRAMHASGVMQGTTEVTFAPEETLTRAQVIATIFRIHHGRAANASDPRDGGGPGVEPEQWFAPYATWARTQGVFAGHFMGNNNAMREDIALFIFHYIEILRGMDTTSTSTAEWRAFTDRDDTTWTPHYNALRWANNNGIVNGMMVDGEARIMPKGHVTRAQAAAILVRLMDLLEDVPILPPSNQPHRATPMPTPTPRPATPIPTPIPPSGQTVHMINRGGGNIEFIFHRSGCALIRGHATSVTTRGAAVARGAIPCSVCRP